MIERSKLSWENSILTHIFQNFHCQKKKKKLTRKWRYIALFLVDKKLDPWGKLPIFLTPWTVFDTALTSLTRQQCKKKNKKKKRKSQILTDGLTNTIDFAIYPKTTSLRSPETHIYPPTLPLTSSLPIAAVALCPSPELDQADRRAP